VTDYRIGVDLGGTKIELAALAPDGTVAFEHRVPTPRVYAEAIAALVGLVTQAEAALGTSGTVGIGVPGRIDPRTNLLRSSTCLDGHRFGPDMSAVLGREVRVANDAGCFVLSEAVDGAGAGARVVFGAILGTGCGGGIVIDGRLLDGHNGIAGEWGHTAFPFAPGEKDAEYPCWCGRRGCNETVLAGPALARTCDGPGARDARSIPARAKAGNPAAIAALAMHAERLARALTDVVNLLDPNVIILGGGLSNMDHLYEQVPPLMAKLALVPYWQTPVLRNVHGDSSGVRGAAWLWPR
jgi:fructokinase